MTKSRTEQFGREIQEYLEYNDNGEVFPAILWDACKAVMRGTVIAVTSFLKKQREENIKTLQTELKNLESEHIESTVPKVKIEIKNKKTKNKLKSYTHKKFKRNCYSLNKNTMKGAVNIQKY